MSLVIGPSVVEWVANRAEADPRKSEGGIGWTRDGELTAGVFYEDYTGSSITATMAVADGAVMVKEFLRTIFSYPFEHMNCNLLVAHTAENNHRSRRMLEKMGFVEVARINDYYDCEALITYGMRKEACRFIGESNGKEN